MQDEKAQDGNLFDRLLETNHQEYLRAKEILKDSELITDHRLPGYAHTNYKLVYSPIPPRADELTSRHGAVLADDGNLCFGGRSYCMNIDKVADTVTFTGIYHTD